MSYNGILIATINDLKFVQTCAACPEQYDVFNNKNQIVGYVRLRWGGLTCEYPDCGGELIYEASIGDGWSGCFKSDRQRQEYLSNIAGAILRRSKKEDCSPTKYVRCICDFRDSVFGPWYDGECYKVVKYDDENKEWHIENAYGEAGLVDHKEFLEYFERIKD